VTTKAGGETKGGRARLWRKSSIGLELEFELGLELGFDSSELK